MIKVVCDVCGAEEATSALSADWRTVSSTVEAWDETTADLHDPAHLCSATCIARWAENHGAEPPASEKPRPERGMADQMKRAMKRQVDLRTLEESDPAS